MAEVKYVCTGSCGGQVSEEEYNQGKTTCGDPNCEKHGQPLEKKLVCSQCGKHFEPGEDASCPECS